MNTPAPPSVHCGPVVAGCVAGGVARRDGDGAAGVVGCRVVRVGVGAGAVVLLAGVGLAEGEAAALRDGDGRGGAGSSFGADWATGAVGRVEPTTKWMVAMTAVTLAVVQDSQMIR
ncbi:hypothetical protein [Streptomyces poriticola]|uniref:hypothetical protein n=1 Tax=Streptomyces poriticola TaxID=3120506 RepID=UPI002FCDED57